MTDHVRSPAPFTTINGRVVAEILEQLRPQLMHRVLDAYRAFGRGQVINPHSAFLSFAEARPQSLDRIIALAAHVADPPATGLKWISSFPDNLAHDLPRASAVIILNDSSTGQPICCMEGSQISAERTASSAALGADLIMGGRRSAGTLGVVGGGYIAKAVLRALSSQGWRFETVLIHDHDPGRASAFAAATPTLVPTEVARPTDLATTLAESELLVFATTVGEPYVHSPAAMRNDARVLNISLRDLGPDVILAADNVVDDIDHCLRAGTSPHLAEQKLGTRAFSLRNIYDCYDQEARRCWAPGDRPVIYSPFGMAVLDITLAATVHAEAVARGQAQVVPHFLPSW